MTEQAFERKHDVKVIQVISTKSLILLLAILTAAGALSCGLGMTFVTQDNLRVKTLRYDGFTVAVSAGGKAGARKAIVLHVRPRREITVLAERMKVYFRGAPLGYNILSEEAPAEGKDFTLFWGQTDIAYLLDVNGLFNEEDSLLFFASGIFRAGERSYDLDTLVFKIPQ